MSAKAGLAFYFNFLKIKGLLDFNLGGCPQNGT